MLIKNMDGNLVSPGNPFYETLKGQSRVFQDTLETSHASRKGTNKSTTSIIRPGTSSSYKVGSKTSRISFNNIPLITNHKANNNAQQSDDEEDKNVKV